MTLMPALTGTAGCGCVRRGGFVPGAAVVAPPSDVDEVVESAAVAVAGVADGVAHDAGGAEAPVAGHVHVAVDPERGLRALHQRGVLVGEEGGQVDVGLA